jgi:NACHT domain
MGGTPTWASATRGFSPPLVATLGVTTVALGRGLNVLINPADVAAVADGVLVNAVWAVGQMVARPRESRRTAAGLDTAAWADTERLIKDALADVAASREFPSLSERDAAELTLALERHEVQGALQALLAVRLTDAPEADAARAREAVRLALGKTASPPRRDDRRAGVTVPSRGGQPPLRATAQPEASAVLPGFEAAGSRYATLLSEYFDDKICGLVATLEGRVGFAGLAQVRAEAYNARMVALLGAIERQVAALADPGREGRDETEFLQRYRRQARQRHGFLTPPDFDRRRRVRVADIYVATAIVATGIAAGERRGWLWPRRGTARDALKVGDLAERLDRTVLLGDPGGGKTTAANVLTDYFANDASGRIPFLVTLREYAAQTPIAWSVAECIEQNLGALYQCPAPEALVERLLVTGRAVVIFDGLDELLDTSRRRDVSDRVEQFCSAYPLTPVLVTSRVVGYDQARLDDTQFTCYRLGGFGDDDVAEYARKWFASQEGMPAAEAQAKARSFVKESAHARDLRANPLLLSLMCILYRGAGSLPGDRAGIYARCAELLLRKWDEQRELYRKIEADHLVEPTLRYLAWWLFTRDDSRTVVTERELIAKSAEFLLRRGYETDEEAYAAARDFVEFCQGRMWVFSEAGTTAEGERVYGFTHRTFLEYFAASHLAATSDTAEDLARRLAPRVARGGWAMLGVLALQIKGQSTDQAADRGIAELLARRRDYVDSTDLLIFLAACVEGTRPSPATARLVTRAIVGDAFLSGRTTNVGIIRGLINSGKYQRAIYDELTNQIAEMVSSEDLAGRARGLRFILEMTDGFRDVPWRPWADDQVGRYRAEIIDLAAVDHRIRACAVRAGAISTGQALTMTGGLSVLLADRELVAAYQARLTRVEEPPAEAIEAIEAIGRFITAAPELPWVRAPLYDDALAPITWMTERLLDNFSPSDEFTGLGLAVAIAVGTELSDLLPPIRQTYRLPEWPMSKEFRQLFRDWAAGRVNFVELVDGEPDGEREATDRSS